MQEGSVNGEVRRTIAERVGMVGMCGHVWACVGMCGHVWACVGMCGHVWEMSSS
jgi:hypothetical protein